MRSKFIPILAILGIIACGSGEDAVSEDDPNPPKNKGGSNQAGSAGESSTAGVGGNIQGGEAQGGEGGSTTAGAAGEEAGGEAGEGGSTTAGAGDEEAGGEEAGGEAGEGGSTTAGAGGKAGGETIPSCTKEPGKSGTKALLFDGVDDSVSMGVANKLGLKVFTLEAWVRRDGDGKKMSTGVGGLSMVPLISKGRGEEDGSNLDCNYAFGFVGEKLAIDFEDMASGGNHPLVGNQAIPRNEWHHVAATFDGSMLRLYVDGALDSSLPTNAVPRADSIQHFGLGAAFTSKGVASGAFHGVMDEVRVWNSARSAKQIATTAFSNISDTTAGLLARWTFEKGNADGAPAGAPNGAISGAKILSPGAPLDMGLPPVVDLAAPAGGEAVTSPAILSVSFQDQEGEAFDGDFYLRKITDADDFTIVVLPDTQYYTEEKNDWRKHYYAQTQWIVDNRKKYNIVGVIHNGDISNNGQKIESQWKVADKAMSTLENEKTTGLKDGIPYTMTIGNHDNKDANGNTTTGNTGFFNKYFGIKRFSGRAYYGGHYGTKNDENYVYFSAGGLDFLVVSYQYIADDTPYRQAVMKWGRALFDGHPDAFGIVNSHYIIGSTAKFGDQGKALYNSVSTATNVHLMTCGHVSAESRREDTTSGHKITTMLADYQFLGNKDHPSKDVPSFEGGSGYMRIWEFSPKNRELTVRTYSPSLKKWQTDDNSEFTIKNLPLEGSGGAFKKVEGVKIKAKTAFVTTSALESGAVYEWYAKISDCDHITTTPIYRFKAK